MDHRSLRNKDRGVREKEEEIESKNQRGKVIERERLAGVWGVGVDGVSGPTWENKSSEMRVWLKGPPCPQSAQLLVAGREEDQKSPGLVQVLGLQKQTDHFWNKSLGCHDDVSNRATLFRTAELMHVNVSPLFQQKQKTKKD